MKKIVFIFFIFTSIICGAQNKEEKNIFDDYQNTLLTICKKLFTTNDDKIKLQLNQELINSFENVLNTTNSFDYEFDSLKKYMGILKSSDEKIRIINWNIPNNDETQTYFGFIQSKYIEIKKTGLLKKQKNEIVQLYPLIDKSSEIKNPDNAITDNKKWYGMLYYKIILKKTKTKKYYTLLARDMNDKFSQKKIIDVLTFDSKGIPHFGADIFNFEKKYPKRIIFEYASNCTMSLKYSSKKDSIIFDHLAPNQPQLEGQFQYYCGDMSYDGFGFKHGKWNYGKYLNAINEKDEKDKLYHDPHDIRPSNNQSNLLIKKEKKGRKKK